MTRCAYANSENLLHYLLCRGLVHDSVCCTMSPFITVPGIGLRPATRFLIYGLIGWCVEIIFTSLHNIASGVGDFRLTGISYLWMHPIWGVGFLACEEMGKSWRALGLPWWTRAVGYTFNCFIIEYAAGMILRAVFGAAPWDYSAAALNIHGLIRLDYAPFWAAAGFAAERIGNILERVQIHRHNVEPTGAHSR